MTQHGGWAASAEMVSQLVLFPVIESPFCERTQQAMCRIGNLDFSQQFWKVVGNSRNIRACAKLGPDIPMKIIMKQWPAPVEKRPMA